MFVLNKIAFKNFRLFKSTGLPVTPGTYFIGGENLDIAGASSNMAGKSTLIAGLVWCLYGTDLTGKALADNVVSEGETYSKVTAHFAKESDANHYVIVERTRFNSGVAAGVSKNMVRLTVNGTVTDKPAAEAQPEIDLLFGPVHLFLAAHVFAFNSQATPFADSPDTEQKRLFDLLIGVGDLNEALDRAKKFHADYKRKIGETEWRLTSTREALTTVTAKLQEANADMRKTQDTTGEVKALRDALNKLNKERLPLEHDVKTVEQEYEQTVQAGNALITAAETSLRETAAGIAAIDSALETIDEYKAIATTDTGAKPTCPVCRQNMTADKWNTVLSVWEKRIVNLNKDKAALRESADKQRSIIAQKRKQIADCEHARNCAHARLLENDRALQAAKFAFEKAQEVQQARQADKQAYITALQIERQNLEVAEQDAGKYLVELRERCAIYEFWVEAFGPRGIRAYRLDMLTPALNKFAAHYSKILFGDDTVLRYSTQTKTQKGDYRDKFEAALYRQTGKTLERVTTALSAGQAMRRDIIHTFAMVELAHALGKRTCNLLVLDELFVSIDQRGIDAVIRALSELNRIAGTMWIIEHNDDLRSYFAQSMTVRRKDNASCVILDV